VPELRERPQMRHAILQALGCGDARLTPVHSGLPRFNTAPLHAEAGTVRQHRSSQPIARTAAGSPYHGKMESPDDRAEGLAHRVQRAGPRGVLQGNAPARRWADDGPCGWLRASHVPI